MSTFIIKMKSISRQLQGVPVASFNRDKRFLQIYIFHFNFYRLAFEISGRRCAITLRLSQVDNQFSWWMEKSARSAFFSLSWKQGWTRKLALNLSLREHWDANWLNLLMNYGLRLLIIQFRHYFCRGGKRKKTFVSRNWIGETFLATALKVRPLITFALKQTSWRLRSSITKKINSISFIRT